MKTKIFIITIFLSLFVSAVSAAGKWRLHPSFAETLDRVIETPGYVYLTAGVMAKSDLVDQKYVLFRYDKEGEEMIAMSPYNGLAYFTVSDVQYNPKKGYLAVLYSNSDIDLLYDNGRIVNIPALRLSSVSNKSVNCIVPDPDNNRLYLATEFGYVSVNDSKGEIADSRNYGEPLQGAARLGNRFLIINGNDILSGEVNEPRLSLEDYEKIAELESPKAIYPMSSDKCIVITEGGSPYKMVMIDFTLPEVKITQIGQLDYKNIEYNKSGISVTTKKQLLQVDAGGLKKSINRPETEHSKAASSYDFSEIWHADTRNGLNSGVSRDNNWIVTRESIYPDAPGPFFSYCMDVHPQKGLLVSSYGWDGHISENYSRDTKQLFSGYNNGRWTNYSTFITNPTQAKVMSAPHSLVVDPQLPEYVYLNSRYEGILRINLNDPEDILHLTDVRGTGQDLEGFVGFVAQQRESGTVNCHFGKPHFDYYGNMWMPYYERSENPPRIVLYTWPLADRKNSKDAKNVVLPTKLEIPGYPSINSEEVLPLTTSGRRNCLVYKRGKIDERIILINTNGTPDDNSDDQIIESSDFYDQDGNSVPVQYINFLYEDPSTGYVWAGHQNGLIYINPQDWLNGRPSVYRIKVSRNDGTNLADYLLNSVTVTGLAVDGNGNKWFSTMGGGLVKTSSDGREILEEVTTSNSDIPSDEVYTISYYPANNSLMVSTSEGISEYFLSGSASGPSDSAEEVKCYPNPVRPEYLGYVTIEGIPSGNLVKVADSAGHVVKELGRSEGGDVKWDVTNSQFKRVNSGVYFILSSPGPDSSEKAVVGKVLVVN